MTQATDGMLAKVRNLLDLAEHPDTPAAEAKLAQERADAIMAKYAIEINDLLASKTLAEGVQAPAPIPFDLEVTRKGQFMNHYAQLWGEVYRHVSVRSKGEWSYRQDDWIWMARGVGFEADVQYAEWLFTAARKAFSERLEPKVNPELSDQVNVYRLRSAGLERIRIADIMWGNTDKVFLGRVGRLYKAECQERGEEAALSGRGVTGAAYRKAYADSFVIELARRLRMARSGGNGVALGNREQVLNEAFYARFPGMRPKAEVSGGAAYERCEKCERAKSGLCRDHRLPAGRRVKGFDPYGAAAVRGRSSGAAAANAVEISRTSGPGAIGGA